jgi:hypothetical protein
MANCDSIERLLLTLSKDVADLKSGKKGSGQAALERRVKKLEGDLKTAARLIRELNGEVAKLKNGSNVKRLIQDVLNTVLAPLLDKTVPGIVKRIIGNFDPNKFEPRVIKLESNMGEAQRDIVKEKTKLAKFAEQIIEAGKLAKLAYELAKYFQKEFNLSNRKAYELEQKLLANSRYLEKLEVWRQQRDIMDTKNAQMIVSAISASTGTITTAIGTSTGTITAAVAAGTITCTVATAADTVATTAAVAAAALATTAVITGEVITQASNTKLEIYRLQNYIANKNPAPVTVDKIVYADRTIIQDKIVTVDKTIVQKEIVTVDKVVIQKEIVTVDRTVVSDKLVPVTQTVVTTQVQNVPTTVTVDRVVTVKDVQIVPQTQVVPTDRLVLQKEVITVDRPLITERVTTITIPQISTQTQIVPTTQISTQTQIVPTDRLVTNTQIVPTDRLVTNTQIVPVDRLVTNTQIVPVTQTVTIEKVVPVEKTIVQTQVQTVEKTLVQTQVQTITQTNTVVRTDTQIVKVPEVTTITKVVPTDRLVTQTQIVPTTTLVTQTQIVPTTQTVVTTQVQTVPTPPILIPQPVTCADVLALVECFPKPKTEKKDITYIDCADACTTAEVKTLQLELVVGSLTPDKAGKLLQNTSLAVQGCGYEPTIAVPEWWQARPEYDRPQLIVSFAEYDPIKKKLVSSAKYTLTIPHWQGAKPTKSPISQYLSGKHQRILRLKDNSKVIVFAKDEATAILVLGEAKKVINPAQLVGAIELPGGNLVGSERLNKNKLYYPKVLTFYSKGISAVLKPDWIVNLPKPDDKKV